MSEMFFWAIIISALAGFLGVFYLLFMRNLDVFKESGLVHMRPLPIVGNMARVVFAQESVAHTVQRIYNLNRQAKYVGFFDLMTPVVVIRDLELIKSIGVKHFDNFPNRRGIINDMHDPLIGKNLLSLRDDKWREVRNLLSPAYTPSKIKGMFKLMSDRAAEFTESLFNLPPDKNVMDMRLAFTKYANDVIASCSFDINTNSVKEPNNELYVLGRQSTFFNTRRAWTFFFVRSFPKFTKMLGIKLMGSRIGRFFLEAITSTIDARDRMRFQRPDLLQLMMDVRGKQGELTIEEIVSHAFIFFFAGYDTTATVLCFAMYELAMHPELQDRLHDEIDRVLEENDGKLTYEALNKMEFLEAVINETLRLYPPTVSVDRICVEEFDLPPALPGAKPYTVKKGDVVWFPIYGLQRDPNYFEDPDTFDPDRFMDKDKKLANHPAYLPFGIGPRICIGTRFGLLETKAMIFHLLAKCVMRPCAKTLVPMRFNKHGFGLMADGGYWLKVEQRATPAQVEGVITSASESVEQTGT